MNKGPWETDTEVIQVAGLTKDYGAGANKSSVLREVQLVVHLREMVAIMGPSGSGKSTLLSILGLLVSPTSGSYLFSGQDVLRLSRREQARFRRTRVGFVFQSCDLLERSTVFENLEYPLVYAGVTPRKRKEMVAEALETVHMSHKYHHPANLLSGGEEQRVAVARALVNHPQAILADEPTGQLDRANSEIIMDYFSKISENSGTTIITATHNPLVAARCNRVLVLEDGILREG
jgi:putative ABC transport system ATP-binding protein